MKDVIDVMELQKEKQRGKQQPLDYRKLEFNGGFTPARFIFECGIKLRAQPLTIATATVLMHRFFKEVDQANYDCYLIASSTLYLAGKIKDDSLKIRDIINVSYSTLHRSNGPLEIGDEFWNMRDAIVQAELLIMRILKFEVTITHPHKYLLHYLRSLEGLLGKEQWSKFPIARGSAAFLQDFHHDPSILDYDPKHIAAACITLTLQCYGVSLPLMEDTDDETWYTVFVKDLQRDKHWEIMEKIMEVYTKDEEF
ncbi:PREDICTED: cyclin-related protein FAM58A [Nicrophorus vespilloides]|uniref:Cyclin-Q n=1 Tax=Nicrophorus vespilloides TaxID=110193 RepID=A0ABM1LZP6_NICVS|nr:PREDICTED: cyclin-related protein FAM58A [Nicrophorus vespilloides]XP_017767794.1 PREDICTED: cyclin-related protein FAM58A [Nicrophorus vespilloides]XP_017767795.1 PREDICTED: cyclin-related protein FAM58A [Nicrophorus vespilloides]XP_017767796.1 PREDICTED: cyclin-related protein FAM58A [Nicrophorus vespilloides]